MNLLSDLLAIIGIVEPCTQVILLGDRVKLLAGEFETVGDGFLLSRKVAPGAGAL